PPRATLFPYTTLFRSRAEQRLGLGGPRVEVHLSDVCALPPRHVKDRRHRLLDVAVFDVRDDADNLDVQRVGPARGHELAHSALRSEEHTSELQSPYDL